MRAIRAKIIRKRAAELHAPFTSGFKRFYRKLKREWIKTGVLAVLCLFLAGCATSPMQVIPVKVGDAGKTKYYVIGNTKIGVLGDEVATIDRYDENGALQHASDISTTGTVHDVLKAAAGSSGTAAVMTPVIGDLLPATTAVVEPAASKK